MTFALWVGRTFRILLSFVGENLVCDSHLDVVSLGGEEKQGLVLRFPSEARDGPVAAGRVHMARDAKRALKSRRIRSEVALDSRVGNAFD